MLVTVEELSQTDLYPEIISKITRGNQADADLQLATAEDIVKSYMSKYDLVAIFGSGDSAPTVESLAIKRIIKTIASWYLVRKANPNVNIELFYDEYKTAIKWLEDLQAGKINPGLPYKPDNSEDGSPSTEQDVFFTSLPKQTNFF